MVLALGRHDVKGEGRDTFNEPTHVAIGPNGDIFITDGYQNQRVVKFNISVADACTGGVLDTIEKAGGHGLAVDSARNLYTAGLADRFSRYRRIRP